MPSKRPRIHVLVVDDHRTFAEALALAIGLERDFEPHVAGTGLQAMQMAGAIHPRVVLMDIKMPGMGGVEAIRRIREIYPEALVLALSAYDEDLLKAQAIEAGAMGYISKETPLVEIPELIRRIDRGEALLEQREIHRLLRLLRHRRHQDSTERQRANRLSPRQIEILQLMADGATTAEIVEQLQMSPQTLRTHVQNILTRLGVHTKIEALSVALRHGKVQARG